MATSARVDVGTFLDARRIGARQWRVLLLGYFVNGVSPGGYASRRSSTRPGCAPPG